MTGLLTLIAEWNVTGLKADRDAIDRYEVRVHWGVILKNVPALDESIKADLNVTNSPVSKVAMYYINHFDHFVHA